MHLINFLADNMSLNSGNINLIVKFPNLDILFSSETLFESRKPAVFHNIFFHYISIKTKDEIIKKLPPEINLEDLEPDYYLKKSNNKWTKGNMNFQVKKNAAQWFKNSNLTSTGCQDLIMEQFDSGANFRLLYKNEPIQFIYINQFFNEIGDNTSRFLEFEIFEDQNLIYNCLMGSSPFQENKEKSKWTKTEFKKLKEEIGNNQFYNIIYKENTISGVASPFASRDSSYEINISINLTLKKGVIGIRHCQFE